LTRNKIKEITIGFECLHGIPYIIGAIDNSHVPIIAPKVDPKSELKNRMMKDNFLPNKLIGDVIYLM
jgi:hypothetical protein